MDGHLHEIAYMVDHNLVLPSLFQVWYSGMKSRKLAIITWSYSSFYNNRLRGINLRPLPAKLSQVITKLLEGLVILFHQFAGAGPYYISSPKRLLE